MSVRVCPASPPIATSISPASQIVSVEMPPSSSKWEPWNDGTEQIGDSSTMTGIVVLDLVHNAVDEVGNVECGEWQAGRQIAGRTKLVLAFHNWYRPLAASGLPLVHNDTPVKHDDCGLVGTEVPTMVCP